MIASTEAAKHSVREHGFAVLERHLDTETLKQTLCWHDEVIAKIDPRDIGHSVSGSNTRAHLPAHNPNLGHLYLDPALLAIAEGVLDAPFRLSGFLSRTVHPGAGDQPLHVDMARSSDGPSLLGFIYMLDEFYARGLRASAMVKAGTMKTYTVAESMAGLRAISERKNAEKVALTAQQNAKRLRVQPVQ